MDLPPAIVIETPDLCGDGARAEASVRESMRASVAPAANWTVRVSSASPTQVVAVLSDDAGRPVAHRDLSVRATRECLGTMHALGVWASLVLDAEVDRAHERARAEAAKIASQKVQNTNISTVVNAVDEVPVDRVTGPPMNPHRLELGVSSVLASGVGGASATPVFAGGGLFVFVGIGRGLYMRPSVSYSRSLSQELPVDWGVSRIDVCLRVPGNYTEHRGLQLDACLGPEVGMMSLKGTDEHSHIRPLFGFGPTISLRGELASALGVEVGVASAYNIVHGEEGDPIAPLSIRAELGLSWGIK